nr:EFR1 family ferrodoxin [Sedimentibacter sp.]
MKVLVLYFSGTGNTAYVGKYIAERLKCENFEVRTVSIEMANKSIITEYDYLIFGFPVYACDVPLFVQNYLKEFPLTKNKSVFIYCTKAIESGVSLIHAQKIFEKNGYYAMGLADVKMPGSDGLAFVKKDSSMVIKIQKKFFENFPEANYLIERVIKVQKSVESGENINKYKVTSKIGVSKKIIGQILMKVYPFFENNLKKKFWADDKCIKCKKCEKICPSHNIEVKERVEFDDKCYLCMRCIHQCPTEAIQIGKNTEGKFRWKGPNGSFNPLEEIKSSE